MFMSNLTKEVMSEVIVIGAGLAGCELSYQLAERGISVQLYEMKPTARSPAHVSEHFAELVCSNSFRSNNPMNAVGLLKEEMRRMKSLIMQAAEHAKVPAGDALAVNRDVFAAFIHARIEAHPNIEVVNACVKKIPDVDKPVVCATGPLTAPELAQNIIEKIGTDSMAFYDAIAPIIDADSINFEHAYFKSRWDKGEARDYVNCPMDQSTYAAFIREMLAADAVHAKSFEELHYFEGCLPLEEMASRGIETLRFGPLKPVGLAHPETDERFHAVLQLRKENVHGTAYNLVGCQTRLKQPDQKRIFRMVPGLENARFLRFGAIHRNTYLNTPDILQPDFSLKDQLSTQPIYFAGQMTGVEGYVESTASGMLVAASIAARLSGRTFDCPPPETMLGGLARHVRGELILPKRAYEPSNITWALVPPPEKRPKSKKQRKEILANRARDALTLWLQQHDDPYLNVSSDEMV